MGTGAAPGIHYSPVPSSDRAGMPRSKVKLFEQIRKAH